MAIVIGLPFYSIAHATSSADGNVHIFNSLHVGGTGDLCTLQNRTTNWADPNWWRSTWNYQANYDGARDDTEAFINQLNANMTVGSGWAVTVNHNPNDSKLNMITIQTFPPSATLTVMESGALRVSGTVRSLDIFLNPGSDCRLQNWNAGGANVSAYGNYIQGQNGYFLVASDNIIYPAGYEGPQIPTTDAHAHLDLDGDGLDAAGEELQDTSDTNKDTDGDGLSDLIESQSYVARNDVFCGPSQCAYPDPTHKDIY